MARVIQQTRVFEDHETGNQAPAERTAWTAARIVSLITGILLGILAIRFLLSLLGANRGNVFAGLIYDISQPFVAPFFGLFNYQMQYGVARFEMETLVAMVIYALIGWVIARMLTANAPAERV